MQTAARQLIISWNTQAGVSRITRCDFHRPISHTDTYTHAHRHTYRQGDVRRGGALSPEAWVSDIIEDASPWQHCESVDSIQNSDTAFSWVCTTAGKHKVSQRRRKICNIPGHKRHCVLLLFLFLSFSYFVFEVISALHKHSIGRCQ